MKYIAKQIDPEYQESPLRTIDDMEMYYPRFSIFGNKSFSSHTTPVLDTVLNVLEQGGLEAILCDIANGDRSVYSNATEAITDCLPPQHKKKYSTRDIHKLRELVSRYAWCSAGEENGIICDTLTVCTGEKYTYSTIRGTAQGDWNEVFYPCDGAEQLKYLEADYFNMGAEFEVYETDENGDEIDSFCMYCYEWQPENVKEEIANAVGCSAEELTVYIFDGYTKTVNYVEAV